MRAISAPPNRPEQLMRIPCAPSRIADCTARFIARRNATRRSSCCAMPSAISLASISGLRISTILRLTSLLVTLVRSVRSFSISAPFFPITTPGRAECNVIRVRRAARSMTTRESPAWLRRRCRNLRKPRSSSSRFPYSLRANQRDSQVRLMPSRSPIGLTFCPITQPPRRSPGRSRSDAQTSSRCVPSARGLGCETASRRKPGRPWPP